MDKITLEMDRRTATILALCCFAAHSFRKDMSNVKKDDLFKKIVDRPFDEKDAAFLCKVGEKLQDLLKAKAELEIEDEIEDGDFADDEDLFEELFANYTEN